MGAWRWFDLGGHAGIGGRGVLELDGRCCPERVALVLVWDERGRSFGMWRTERVGLLAFVPSAEA